MFSQPGQPQRGRPNPNINNNPYPFAAGRPTPSAASSRANLIPVGGLQSANSSTASLLQPRPGTASSTGSTGSAAGAGRPLVGAGGGGGATGVKKSPSNAPSIASKFSLAPDPNLWGSDLTMNFDEPDDYLHNPDPKRDRRNDRGGTIFTWRGLMNVGCLIIMAVGLLTLFAGYPILNFFLTPKPTNAGGFNLGGINMSGQIPQLIGNFGLIDVDTPQSAMTRVGIQDGSTYELVFSDEFNTDGRSFYPGDDPYWEAVDLHYWETGDLEWYDPRQVTTVGGALKIWLNKTENHGLDYMGGMLSTWNKFCFTGGYIEVGVSIPGKNDVGGLWPAVWTMGNLGRAGYGATLDGMWPYTYDSCDVGTLPNQTLNGQPLSATTMGDPSYDGILSYLPGQRLSACTCPGESHPGPTRSDGSFVGRSAPEIDIFEAQVDSNLGQGNVSQSAQWAPFDDYYTFQNSSGNADYIINNAQVTTMNSYRGGVYQEASSCVSTANQECFTGETGCFAIYGYEYEPGDSGYITWVNNAAPAWTLFAEAMGPNPVVNISQRPIPEEPMYIIANLGISPQFTPISPELELPTYMLIDYVRVYQKQGQTPNIGCDPSDHPTEAYINEYLDAYSNWNLTTWESTGQVMPKNRLIDTC